MRIGDRVVFLFDRTFSHLVRVPAPYSIEQIREHLRHVEPHVRRNLVIRELEVLSETSAEDALRDTIPCPAPGEEAAE